MTLNHVTLVRIQAPQLWREYQKFWQVNRQTDSESVNFPYLSSFLRRGVWGEPTKKWKGNFWFCFAVSVSEKSNHIITFLFALFSALAATEAHPYPRLVVALNSVTSMVDSDNSRIWIVLGTN